jgi:hypothetical protein
MLRVATDSHSLSSTLSETAGIWCFDFRTSVVSMTVDLGGILTPGFTMLVGFIM